ncbi:MAG: hypothetical protein E7049_03900 [Lentisphaerae bacterium]|nr:hypothetical protein [Lentisphaerota bacterium]
MRNLLAVLLSALLVAAAGAAPSLENEAMRSRKGALVLQVGSDWCVSGEAVRKVFCGKEFQRSKTGAQFACGVWDEMESPTDAVKAANESVKSLHIATKRYPAITCFTPQMRVYAQIENVPQGLDADKLAKAVARQTKKKDEAEALFKKAATLKGEEAADCYGEAFDILAPMMGQFHFKELTTGEHGWRKEWDELCKLDAGDRYGWLKHFELDDYKMVAMVQRVTEAKAGSAAGASADGLVNAVKSVPDKHFSPAQKQFVKIMQYALSANGTDKPLTAAQKTLMKEVFALGRDTLWGQFAMGRLMMDGEKIESKGLPSAPVRERPSGNVGGAKPSFPLEKYKGAIATIKPGAKLTEQQKLDIARYAALRLIGQSGWQELVNRRGALPFVKAFMTDREWLEDFAWSGTFPANSTDAWCEAGTGPGAGARAILALESLVFQDNGRWVPFENEKFANNEGRRFMTALAIVYPDKDEAWLADVLDAYRATALAGRLHKTAYSQGVYEWRFAVHAGHATAGCDNLAAQQRHIEKFVNMPINNYGGTPWMIEYRLKNCFGDSVHGPYYYKAWATAGEWPKRRYSQIVGGVCGELSKFGSATANAHGLPSTTVGQPGHCAYSRRLPSGKWVLNYSVTGHSQMHMCFWNKHPWQYNPALEATYGGDRESRLGAERMLALATLADESKKDAKTTELFYRHACAAKRDHYGAWHAYGESLMRSDMPLDKLRVWVRGCARGMKYGREPLWDILTPYFERVVKEKGKEALVEDLVDFAPLLKQSPSKLEEESDFGVVLAKWGDLLGGDEALRMRVLKAMLEAQYGTENYFSQTMGWGADSMMKTKAGADKFNACLMEVLSSKTKNGGGGNLDFSPLILSASRSGNLDAFRQMADMQKKMSPKKGGGDAYPAADFGGELLSSSGLLRTSTTSGFDHPDRYAFCIDETPCGEGAFHTDKEKSPWAEVMLKGPSTILGVVVENRFGGVNASRQVPIEVSVSEDGSTWQRVASDDQLKSTYRFDLRNASPRAKLVRVARRPDAKEDFFHLNKILVYGKKLY